MIAVVLDTNAVGVRAPLESGGFRLLAEAAQREELELVVPELVLREAVNKWRENVEQALAEHRKVRADLTELGVPGTPAADADPHLMAHELYASLVERLEEIGATIADYPEASHADVVSRALGRRQPFDVNGKDGYRDTLLWETVLELVRDERRVALVSDDVRAFQQDRKRGPLARDLQNEAELAGTRAEPVQLFHSLLEATQELVGGTEEALARVTTLLEDRDLGTELAEVLEIAAAELELLPDEVALLGIDTTIFDAYVDPWPEVLDIDIRLARESDDEIVVDGIAHLGVRVVFRYPLADYARLVSTEELGSADLDTDDNVAKASVGRRAVMPFEAVIDPDREKVVAVRPSTFENFDPL